jgi:hypothetical protein
MGMPKYRVTGILRTESVDIDQFLKNRNDPFEVETFLAYDIGPNSESGVDVSISELSNILVERIDD